VSLIKAGQMPRVLRSFATTCCYVNKYDIDSFKKFLDVKLVRDIFLFYKRVIVV